MTPDPRERVETGIGDRVDLALGEVPVALGADLVEQTFGGEALDRSVERADGDVGPEMDVLLLGLKPELVAVHLAMARERVEDEEADG